ncbi:hypothetical protein DV738_g239, partial [Chaetothyriales sp. CBS 135597]
MTTDTGVAVRPIMSAQRAAALANVRKLVPPMLPNFHKGQLGRVAVIGGSADYTGAPYFSAMASARLGCDLSFVICEPSAAATIKSYSPNLMVSPILRSLASLPPTRKDSPSQPSGEELAQPILDMLPRLHVLVIGPGLGRDEITLKQVKAVIQAARRREPPVPMVLDAEALWLIQQEPDIINGYRECILTPNVVEFGRLAKSVGLDLSKAKEETACQQLASILGGVCIIQKGRVDYISQGTDTTVSDFEGGLKRSGGQGDTLTGTLGTFLAWRQAYHDGLWDVGKDKLDRSETLLLAALGGSAITRESSRRAFAHKQRSLQASDLTDEVHPAFLALIGEPETGPGSGRQGNL